MENNIRIILTADLQVKNRTHNLTSSYERVCEEIEQIAIETKANIIVYAGDMLEYPSSNDSERKIIYNHFSNLLNIHSLKELVVMNGNHDIELGKKSISLLSENNPVDTYYNMSKTLSPERAEKLNYLKLQKEYKSKFSDKLSWISYSLEDGTSSGSNLDLTPPSLDVLRIPIFHDILKEYVDDKKLPVSKSKYEYLMEMDKFPETSPLILAGDIHERYTTYKDGKTFLYPGSSCQRNHGEGSYLKIRKNVILNKAPEKYVLQIDVKINTEDASKSTFEVTEIPLKNTLHYITIDFNTKTFVDNWKEQLETGLTRLQVSRNVNIFKLVISNVYMKHEMEILNIINKFFEKHNNQYESANYLELSYGQIVFDSEEELFENELSDANENDSDEEFDIEEENIVLNTDKLNIIFNKVVDNYSKSILKEFSNPEEFNEVVDELKSLFSEQIELFYGNKNSYNVDLDKIATNGFMALGPNEIDLNIPGLTRIVGNNGIGKTTLYNILRWTLKNMVIEGLPKNTKKENLLLVFNDELIDQNKVNTQLSIRVNNIPVLIERYATRVWKKSATDEDKRTKNWKTFIDTVSSTLKVTILHQDKEPVVKLNDEAQALLDSWFGNVPENIMILNQFKILQLLNTSGNSLNEMVLEFAGVDYLKSLEENLDLVKSKYQVSKPDKAQIDIVIEKNRIVEKLELNETIIIDNEKKLLEHEEELKVDKNNLSIKLQEKINLGNVPEKIKNLTAELDAELNIKNSFEFKEIQILPVFTQIKPEKEDTTDLVENIDNYGFKIGTKKSDIVKTSNEFNTEKQNKLDKLNELYNKFDKEIIDFKNEKQEHFTIHSEAVVSELKLFKSTTLNFWREFYKTLLDTDNKELTNNNEKYNTLVQSKNEIITKIATLNKIISSGICQACNRVLDNVEEKIKQAEVEIDELNLKLETVNEDILEINTKKSTVNSNMTLTQSKLNKIVDIISWNSNLNTLTEIESELKIIQNNESIFDTEIVKLEIFTAFYTKLIEIHKLNLSVNEDEFIVTRQGNMSKFNELKNILVTLNLQTELTPTLLKIEFLKSLFDFIELNKTQNFELVNLQNELNDMNEKLTKINNLFNTDLNNFNTDLNNFNNEVTRINKLNSEVNEHNNKISVINANVERFQKEIELQNNNIYEYEKVNKEYNELSQNVEEIEDNIKSKTKTNSDLNNANSLMNQNLFTLNELEEKWKDYRKKNFIYKTFEKLIKKDFKYAIFNFYRQFLNNKLNILLEGLDFRLYWNSDSALYMVKFSKNSLDETETIYRPVKLASGMQTSFLGLSLIYTIHLLNVRNSISHIFIDEISGQLNSGKNTNSDDDDLTNSESKNYQEQLVFLLNKFTKKKIFIIDHVIENFWETKTIEVTRKIVDGNKLSFYNDI